MKRIPPNKFGGECAEVNAISRANNKGIDLRGAEISVVEVRGPNRVNGKHGFPKTPCDVCSKLLKMVKNK